MDLDVLHVVTTLLDLVMKNHMRKMEVPNALVTKAKVKTKEVLTNLDYKKDDARTPPQKKRRTDDPTFVYDEFVDELEDIHDNGVEILVVSNLVAHIELEFNMYEIYKVIDLEKNDTILFSLFKVHGYI